MGFSPVDVPVGRPVFPDGADNDAAPNNSIKPSTRRAVGKPKPGDFISSFAAKAIALLDRIEYRAIVSHDDIEALYRFRYECYHRDGHVASRPDQKLFDHFDSDPRAMRFGVWLDGKMVSAIRLQRVTPERRIGVSMLTFADILDPMLDAGFSFIDPSRLITDRDEARENPQLPYLTVRLAAMAALHFDVDYLLSTIRPRHAAFYKRLSLSRPLSEIKTYPGVEFTVQMYASDAKRDGDKVLSRFPAFHSLPRERDMLFGKKADWDALPQDDFSLYGDGEFDGDVHAASPAQPMRPQISRYLTVLPTARFATRGLPIAA